MTLDNLTIQDLHRAERIARERPDALTDLQIALIAEYDKDFAVSGPRLRAEAISQQRLAQAEVVTKAVEVSRPPAAQQQPAVAVWNHEHEEIGDFMKRCAGKPAGVWLVEAVFNGLTQVIATLQKRIADLEARPVGVQYRGTWSDTQTYAEHEAVTHAGSLWIARSASIGQRPGMNPSAWQLAVKRGSDARSATE